MNEENTQKLFDRFTFFKPERPITEALMAFGFECGDGWFNLIWDLCIDLEKIVNEEEKEFPDEYFEVVQVKEKFGTLRFYVDGGTDAIYKRINKAETDSGVTCEQCGKRPAKPKSTHHWIRTLCEECKLERV